MSQRFRCKLFTEQALPEETSKSVREAGKGKVGKKPRKGTILVTSKNA